MVVHKMIHTEYHRLVCLAAGMAAIAPTTLSGGTSGRIVTADIAAQDEEVGIITACETLDPCIAAAVDNTGSGTITTGHGRAALIIRTGMTSHTTEYVIIQPMIVPVAAMIVESAAEVLRSACVKIYRLIMACKTEGSYGITHSGRNKIT